MRSRFRVGAGVIAAACAVAGCATAPVMQSRPAHAPAVIHGVSVVEPAANPRPYGAADTAFGLNVLTAWCRADPAENLVFSPSTLATGLGMAYLGARGETARAMASVLHLPAAGGQALEAGLQARSAALRGLGGPGVTLAADNEIWADPSLPPLPSYLNALATGYGAGLNRAPFEQDPRQAAQDVNQAIAAATRGQIPQLLTPGMVQDLDWVLTAALYMKAAWATPFPASQTTPGPFTTATGKSVTAHFMKGGGFRAATADGWTAVRLPYRGGKLAMLALLPPSAAGNCATPGAAALDTITGRLAGGGAAVLASGASTAPIELPKVNLSSSGDMTDLLKGLGMGPALCPAGDFSGLSPMAACIGLVQQAATLRVGEKGAVASAAVAIGIEPTAAEAGPAPIVFDRPYLLLVTAASTGEPLFLARVADPAAS
jgi:serine protease inhibitor